jgi:hypothetical protein
MDTRMKLSKQVLAAAAAVGIAAAGGSAFTASNTTPDTAVGQGASTTSGYAVTNVVYTLNPSTADTTGDTITAVSFDTAPTTGLVKASQARVRLTTAGAWTDCVAGTVVAAPAQPFTCTFTTAVEASAATTVDAVVLG